MEFNKEMMEKAKSAKSAEELLAMAKAEGVELTAEDAEKYFAQLHKSGELADEELDNVSGGGCRWISEHSDSGECKDAASVTFLYDVGQEEEFYFRTSSGAMTTRRKIIAREVRYVVNKNNEYVYKPYYLAQNIKKESDVDWYPQDKIEKP